MHLSFGTSMGLVGARNKKLKILFALLERALFKYSHYSIFIKIEAKFWKKIEANR